MGNRLVVAALRLPVTMSHKSGRWLAAPSGGGLVTGLQALARSRECAWIGWPGTFIPEADRPMVSEEIARHGGTPLFLTRSQAQAFYGEFSNRALWPLFHGLIDRVHFDHDAWEAYVEVNRLFADEIHRQAGPGDLVWVHDYQLCLVPEMLRERGLSCPVGFFLHVPFPSSEMYRTLPERERLLRGMLGADLLGFHAYEYVAHFRKTCLRVLGYDSQPDQIEVGSRPVHLMVQPIGIDPKLIDELVVTAEAKEEAARLREAHRGKKIILGVDRLDYTKGLTHKFRAYEDFLGRYPKWRQKAVLVQITAPSRLAVGEYQSLKRELDELVGRINGRYGTATHTPLINVNQFIPQSRLVGLYHAADVALITPIRDGMNLVALEYVAARGEQGSCLVLSEFAGAANLLPGARLVSPYDTRRVADVLADSLESPPSPEASVPAPMLSFVRRNTAGHWAAQFLARLRRTVAEPKATAVRLHVAEPPASELLAGARRPLMLLDYDGTLRAFERHPSDATPNARIRSILAGLADRAIVYIVSGRDAPTLESWLGDLPVGLVCEHGYAVRPNGQAWQHRTLDGADYLGQVERVLEDFCQRTPGSLVEQKRSSVAWHYRSADPEFGAFQASELLTVLEDMLRGGPYHVLRGSRVLEVRHRSISKGHAAHELLVRHADADLVFCAGDDRTDEDMMVAISRYWRQLAVTCWVGYSSLHAAYWVESAEALLGELEQLVELWRSTEPPPSRSLPFPLFNPP